jgi:hypothetical protein
MIDNALKIYDEGSRIHPEGTSARPLRFRRK